ncbi:MAG: hypothetical protein DRN06_04110 [Thermoprotei archaeon]|nr:MAG: hypothetical protein DRN06_04110 [Thermoprotei archaeon]
MEPRGGSVESIEGLTIREPSFDACCTLPSLLKKSSPGGGKYPAPENISLSTCRKLRWKGEEVRRVWNLPYKV